MALVQPFEEVTMTSPSIRSATASEKDRAISTVVTAFSSDPIARWVLPDSQRYLTYFPKFVPLMSGGAFEAGSAYCTDDFSAASLWLPPGVHPDQEAMGALAESAVPAADQEKVFSFLEQMGAYHPTESHWYLPFIAVDPMHQGRGLGSALLIHALQTCDREQLPAYLEATSPDSRRLYERHGFEALGEIQSADSPPLFPMLRKPR
jgi:ribosomal protein S18 acetylase RimI-like enzyme